MYDIQSIYQATSVDDAIRALQADPSAIVIAGGTDVLIKIREGKLAGCSLVSIHRGGFSAFSGNGKGQALPRPGNKRNRGETRKQ